MHENIIYRLHLRVASLVLIAYRMYIEADSNRQVFET